VDPRKAARRKENSEKDVDRMTTMSVKERERERERERVLF
jgi:hypothetical protein